MATQSWNFTNNTLSGTFIKSGSAISAVAAVLFKLDSSDNETQVDYDTTDKNGLWEFAISETGYYTVKFYGAAAATTDVINKIYLAYDATSTDISDLEYTTDPDMSVSETDSKVDVNRGEVSILSFTFSGIIPDSGNLTKIEIYYRRTEDGGSYDHLKTIPIIDSSLDIITIKINLELYAKPDYYDFQAIYINSIGIPYKKSGAVFISEINNFEVDGVPDVYEYIEGIYLEAINTSDPESGELSGDLIKLKWIDLKSLPESAFPIVSQDAFGRPYTITYEIANKLENYVIFMYISSVNQEPIKKHPGLTALYGEVPYDASTWNFKNVEESSDSVGRWVFGGEFSTSSCELTLPSDYYVGFWVGFKTRKTQSNVETDKIVF